jgi:hypothetical protein
LRCIWIEQFAQRKKGSIAGSADADKGGSIAPLRASRSLDP